MTDSERQEAEGLVNLADLLSLLQLRAERRSSANTHIQHKIAKQDWASYDSYVSNSGFQLSDSANFTLNQTSMRFRDSTQRVRSKAGHGRDGSSPKGLEPPPTVTHPATNHHPIVTVATVGLAVLSKVL